MPQRQQTILSGMRPTGRLHLGHYHGVLKNWIELQHEFECFFCAVDLHALTTHYEDPRNFGDNIYEMVVDWLAAGVNPNTANIFVQSWVPEHAELHLLLSMITPNSWLERVPTYKEQREKLKELDLSTYGFLGYPVLQTADILLYGAEQVPVGEDQVSHIELAREIARRFNFLYGHEENHKEKLEQAIGQLNKKSAKQYLKLVTDFKQDGNEASLQECLNLIEQQGYLSIGDKERLSGNAAGRGRKILVEPQAMLTKVSKMPGIDGQKMSKSYGNTISMREDPIIVEEKIKKMPTDPARIRRTDPGDPDKCPVWQLHEIYSETDVKDWVQKGCRSAGIGCLDCKKYIVDATCKEVITFREAAKEYEDTRVIHKILVEGSERAREVAGNILADAHDAMGLKYNFSKQATVKQEKVDAK